MYILIDYQIFFKKTNKLKIELENLQVLTHSCYLKCQTGNYRNGKYLCTKIPEAYFFPNSHCFANLFQFLWSDCFLKVSFVSVYHACIPQGDDDNYNYRHLFRFGLPEITNCCLYLPYSQFVGVLWLRAPNQCLQHNLHEVN